MRSRPRRIRWAWTWAGRAVIASSLAALAGMGSGCAQVVHRPDVVIGTASSVDGDYPLGASICRMFNLETPRHGLRCAEEPSAGAIANVELLRRGRIDIGIVPSDVLADAMAGEGWFASRGRAADLRVLFAGHTDTFTLVAHPGSEIRTVSDLRGKRIGIGRPGSRERAMMDRVMSALGLTRNDLAAGRELSSAKQTRAFCANDLDAVAYSVAHPNGLVREATLTCRGMLVAVSGPVIDRMRSEHEAYERVAIPGGTYPVNPADVPTFGVRALVVATHRMPDTVAYEITRAVLDNIDDFRRLHPAFEGLTIARMSSSTGRAAVHPGAERYYREHRRSPP